MSERDERILKGFGNAARKVVNSYFIKRTMKTRSFSPSEMEVIKKIDEFLHFVFYTKNYNRRTNMICISAKYTIKIKGKPYSLFIDKFINWDDLEYEKCDYLIAKGVYLLTKDRRCDVYFSVASFSVLKGDNGRGKIKRAKANANQETVLFLDCDLDDKQNLMDDDTLRGWVFEKCPLLKNYPMLFMVRSGHGLHIYLPIKAFSVYGYPSRVKYEQIEDKFIRTCVTLNSDVKAKDMVRLLRVPYSYNRKPSFDKPFWVHPITELSSLTEEERISIFDIDEQLDAYIEEHKDEYNGFVEVTDEDELRSLNAICHIDLKKERDYKIAALPSHKIFIEGSDNTDDYASESNVNTSYEESHVNASPISFHSSNALCNNLRSDYVFDEQIIIKNLKIAYKTQKDHRARDIVFYLLNRKAIGFPSEGKRHRLIYLFMYTLYSVGVKDNSILDKETRHLNELLEPGEISHSETSRNRQFGLKRKSQCTSFSFL